MWEVGLRAASRVGNRRTSKEWLIGVSDRGIVHLHEPHITHETRGNWKAG